MMEKSSLVSMRGRCSQYGRDSLMNKRVSPYLYDYSRLNIISLALLPPSTCFLLLSCCSNV